MILKKNDITKQIKNFTTNSSLIEICPIDKSILVLSFISSTSLFCFLDCEFIALVFIIIYVGAIAVLFLFVIMMLEGNLRKGGEAAFWAPFFSKDDYKLIEKAMRTCYAEEDSKSIADFKASAPKTMAEISETLQNARRSLDCKLKITSEEIPNVSPEIIRKDREIDQNIDTLIQNSQSEESFLTPETKDAFIGTFQNSADIHEALSPYEDLDVGYYEELGDIVHELGVLTFNPVFS